MKNSEVLILQDRVVEAQRLANLEMKNQDKKGHKDGDNEEESDGKLFELGKKRQNSAGFNRSFVKKKFKRKS